MSTPVISMANACRRPCEREERLFPVACGVWGCVQSESRRENASASILPAKLRQCLPVMHYWFPLYNAKAGMSRRERASRTPLARKPRQGLPGIHDWIPIEMLKQACPAGKGPPRPPPRQETPARLAWNT